MSTQEKQQSLGFQEVLKEYFLCDSRDLAMVVLYGVFVSLCSLVVPVAVQTFVNTLGFGLLLQPILILATIVFFALSFSGVANLLQIYVMELLQQRWFSRMALVFAHRLNRIQLDSLRKSEGPQLATYFLEIVSLQKTLSVLILDGVAVVLQIFFGMVLLALYHPYFVVFDLLILGFILVGFVGPKQSAIESSIKESKAKFETASWLAEIVRNSFSFRSEKSRQFAMDRVDELAAKYVGYRKKHYSVLMRQIGGATLLQIVMSSLLLGVGGWLVIQRQLSLGQLVAAELVFGTVVAGISKFGKYLEAYYDLYASVDKLNRVLSLPEEVEGSEVIDVGANGHALIQVKDVGYQNDFGREIFAGLSFEVKSGTITAIVGGHGSGKSTLAEFLYGVRNPSSGLVMAGSIDLKYPNKENFRSQVDWVSPGGLLTGTILDNIRVGREDLSVEQVQVVTSGLGMNAWLEALPEGLMTQITCGRFPLSSGQAQQVLLARALIGQPRLLIVDDLIDLLDPSSVSQIVRFMKSGASVGAVVLTTRNSDLSPFFDQTVSLPDGKVSTGQPLRMNPRGGSHDA